MNLFWIITLVAQSPGGQPAWIGAEQTVRVVVAQTMLAGGKQAQSLRAGMPPLVLTAVNPDPGEPGVYEIRYIGLEAGEHDLRDYLEFSSGVTRQMLPPMTVRIADPLPPTHRGELGTPPILSQTFPELRLVRGGATLIAGLWVLGLVGCALAWRRSARRRAAMLQTAPVDDLPHRLQLAEMFLQTPDRRAEIELQLLACWRRELNMQSLRQIEFITALQQHPRGRELLAAFEGWNRRLEHGPAELPPILREYARPAEPSQPASVGAGT